MTSGSSFLAQGDRQVVSIQVNADRAERLHTGMGRATVDTTIRQHFISRAKR